MGYGYLPRPSPHLCHLLDRTGSAGTILEKKKKENAVIVSLDRTTRGNRLSLYMNRDCLSFTGIAVLSFFWGG